MTAGDLSPSLLQLIRASVPTFSAAELLVFLHRNPVRQWTAEQIVDAIRPVVIPLPAIRECLSHFLQQGLVTCSGGAFTYAPQSEGQKESVGELSRAYDERPVTLIRTIYLIADLKIQSFADSFRLPPKKGRE